MNTQIRPSDEALSDVGKLCYVWVQGGEFIAKMTSAGFDGGPPPTFTIVTTIKKGGYVSPDQDRPDLLYPYGSCRYDLLEDRITELERVLEACKAAATTE